MNIKAKIIGNQIWTSEDVTLSQLKVILLQQTDIDEIKIPLRNDNSKWLNHSGLCCCTYFSNVDNKKHYLYNREVAEMTFQELRKKENGWRLPNIDDWVQLFKYLDEKNDYDFWSESIAESLRGTYGWPINGTNKIGFNAIPNFKRNEDGSYVNESYASWWVFSNRIRNEFSGMSLYPENIIAEFSFENKTGLAMRLVRNLKEPRPEEDLLYV